MLRARVGSAHGRRDAELDEPLGERGAAEGNDRVTLAWQVRPPSPLRWSAVASAKAEGLRYSILEPVRTSSIHLSTCVSSVFIGIEPLMRMVS